MREVIQLKDFESASVISYQLRLFYRVGRVGNIVHAITSGEARASCSNSRTTDYATSRAVALQTRPGEKLGHVSVDVLTVGIPIVFKEIKPVKDR